MSNLSKPPFKRAPNGVVTDRPIALRLLAPELATHARLVAQHTYSSAAFAREMYLRGLESYQRDGKPLIASHMATVTGVSRA